jgi:hypothetical protein
VKQGQERDGAEPAPPGRVAVRAPVALASPLAPLTPARVVALQRLAGNAAVAALVDDRRPGSGGDGGTVTAAPLGPSILDDVAAAGAREPKTEERGAGPAAKEESPPAAGGDASPPTAAPAGAAVAKDPHADPRFQSMKARTKSAAGGAKAHAPAKSGAAAAQAAALPPGNDAAGQAAAAQVDTMSEQKPGTFDRAAFIAAVKAAIDKAAPKNLEEADDFKADGVKDTVSGQVKDGKKGAEKDIKGATDAPPDPSKAKPKPVTPMAPEEVGPAPPKVGAADAMPPKVPESRTDLEQGPREIDKQMAGAEVTDEQIHNSNEPDFKAALGARDAAKEHADTAPDGYRKQEQDVLGKAHGAAEQAEVAQLAGMHSARGGALSKAAGHKHGAKSQDEAKRAKVATDVQGIYDRTKADVTKTLDGLDGKVDSAFTAGEAGARKRFEDYVAQQMDAYKEDRYSGLLGKGRWLKDKLMGMPAEVDRFYAQGRNRYLADMDGAIGRVADVVGAELTAARARIAQGKAEVHKYVTSLPKDLQDVGKEAESNLQSQFDQLSSDVDSKQDELVDTLAKKYVEARDALDSRIDEMKAANRGLVDKAIDAVGGVIKTILQLKNMLMGVLAKAADVIGEIIKDPIGFLGKLIDGVKAGLNRFVGNIAAHLQEGLMGWLFGALGGAGIEIPKTFGLAGIVDLVLQVLGLTYRNIRARVAKLVGEPIVQRLEQTVDVFKTLATEGVGGLWKWIQDRVGDLEDLVIGQIKSFVIEKVIKAGIVWLIAFLNPAAAFIKACKAIYDIVMFLIERGSEIMSFVSSILDSLGAIAKGAIGIVAEKVEGSLAKALPLAISFLASLLGLGGISEKIHSVIEKVRAPINKAVDFVVLGAVKGARKLFGRAKGWATGKVKGAKDWARGSYEGGKRRVRDAADRFTGRRRGAQAPDAKRPDDGKRVEAPFTMHGRSHKLVAKGGKGRELEMHSTPLDLVSKIESMYDALTQAKPSEAGGAGLAALRQEMIQDSHVLLEAAMDLWSRAGRDPSVVAAELPGLAARISAFGERFDRRDLDPEAAEAAKARRKALVTDPVPALFEGIDPQRPPRGWTFTDTVIDRGPDIIRVETAITDPTGGTGNVRREYDRKAKKWTLSSAFLDQLEAWVPAAVPLGGRGINLITYATLRQKKLAGVGAGDVEPALKKQKWSSIVNERTMLQLAKLGGDQSRRDEAITSTHSWTYAMTALTQARYRVVPGTARVVGGLPLQVREMDSFVRAIQSDGEAKAAEKLAKMDSSLTLDSPTWYGFDIEADVEPIA